MVKLSVWYDIVSMIKTTILQTNYGGNKVQIIEESPFNYKFLSKIKNIIP